MKKREIQAVSFIDRDTGDRFWTAGVWDDGALLFESDSHDDPDQAIQEAQRNCERPYRILPNLDAETRV